MKKADKFLIGAVILIAALLVLIAFIINWGKDGRLYARVLINNEVVALLPLDEDTVMTFTPPGGTNVVVIEDGYARIDWADCDNQVCVDTGKVNRVGEGIFCIPHRFSVVIISE